MPRKRNNRIHICLTDDELAHVNELAKLIGLSREEIIGIKWKNIDFENHTLTIRSVVVNTNIDGKLGELEKDRTKNQSSERSFPLVQLFEDLLLKMKQDQTRIYYSTLC